MSNPSLNTCHGLRLLKGLQNSSGVACTCVITEYHYHDATTFEIRIDAFSGEELETQIKDLVHKYRSYHRHRSTLEGPERQVCEEEADVAQDTLMTMFRTKLSNLDWIKNEPDVERVNNQLVGWATSYLGSQDLETQVLDSPKTCSARLQHLTSDMSSGNAPALWPFIRGVKYVVLILFFGRNGRHFFLTFSVRAYSQMVVEG